MYIQLACFLLFLTSSSHGSIPDATIRTDSAQITRLNQFFLSSLPPTFRRMQSLVCEMVDTCCPSIKSNFNDFMGKSSFGGSSEILNACIGSKSSQSFLRTCPMVYKVLPIAQDPEFLNFTVVLVTSASRIQISDVNIERQCSADEAYAAHCKPNARKELESCERKTVTYVAQHNTDDQYKTYIKEVKSSLRSLIKTMRDAFPNKDHKQSKLSTKY
ncbi:hypothetical protein I4U23_003931 [Adineta vaga]|nr:hypothetical protein I4U23_003931 [Adineta vaga]